MTYVPSTALVKARVDALPVQARTAARKQALEYAPRVLERMEAIAVGGTSAMASVQAAKVILSVAALTSTTNLPRDVVREKFEHTVDVLRDLLPPDLFAAVAQRLGPIWSDM